LLASGMSCSLRVPADQSSLRASRGSKACAKQLAAPQNRSSRLRDAIDVLDL
jgi:hypothetical protein